jgi:recombination protein RecT
MSNISIIEADIYGTKEQFHSVLSDNSINFDREAGFAVQVLEQNDYALKIALGNRQSVINAVVNLAAMGLSLNPAKKQAYLVPRDGRICLDISYMGLIDLAVQDGAVRWAKAELVYSSDSFTLNGPGMAPTHSCNPFSKDRGEIIGVYCVAKTQDGDYLTETMSADDVNAIRDRSSAWKAWIEKKKRCPWVTDYGEMARKTVVKRASKYWASTGRLQQAIQHLNTDGEEGLSALVADPIDTGFNAIEHCEHVANAETLEALQALWKTYGAAATKAKDRGGYAMIKNAVLERKAQLEQVVTLEQKND